MKKSEKQGSDAVLKFSEHKRKRVDELEADVDALFRLPLAEFTGARNALAARLKKSGRADEKAEAVRVKALVKAPVSAWAVNQLYWNHREEFDRLIASGERFHKAQTSRSAAKAADMREALDARRKALTQLSALATSLLQAAGHNPSLETIRRITSTLEGMSVYASRADGPQPGRLTHDVDPPGFESFAGFSLGAGRMAPTQGRPASDARRPEAGGGKRQHDARKAEGTRKENIAAKVSLQNAKGSLTEARAKAKSLEAVQKRADAEAKKADQRRRDAEEELRKAKAASEAAAERARNVAIEVEEAAVAVDDAERTVEKAAKELESLSRE